jgi:hypothetical protein
VLTPATVKLPKSQAHRTLARCFNIVPIISAGFAGNTKLAAQPFKYYAVGHEFCFCPSFHGLFGYSKLSSKSQ